MSGAGTPQRRRQKRVYRTFAATRRRPISRLVFTTPLSLLEDGRLELRLKRPWRDGTTAFVFQPQELIERLVAIVPRPRAHLVRYSGVLAPAFAARAQIVPSADKASSRPKLPVPPPEGAEMPKRPGRIPWAPLLWRVFLADVLKCARCSGRMRIVAAVTSGVEVMRILRSIGLAGHPPSFHAARPPRSSAPARSPDRLQRRWAPAARPGRPSERGPLTAPKKSAPKSALPPRQHGSP